MKRKTKKILKITLAILTPFILICLFFALLLFPVRGITYRVADGVTAEGIKKIELGMSKEDVVAILGEPLEVDTNNFGNPNLIYAKYSGVLYGTNFRIHLGSNNCVVSVYSKDEGNQVYWKCKDEYYINEKLFKKYFK